MHKSNRDIFRIGVFSDTHLDASEESLRFLTYVLEEHLKSVDMIFHAGDLEESGILKAFEKYPCHVVRGNMDLATNGLPKKKIVKIGKFKIGLIHGDGFASGIEKRLQSAFRHEQINCFVFGHTHHPVCYKQDGILYFNPGSATDKRGMDYHSVGLLEVGDYIHGHIIRLD